MIRRKRQNGTASLFPTCLCRCNPPTPLLHPCCQADLRPHNYLYLCLAVRDSFNSCFFVLTATNSAKILVHIVHSNPLNTISNIAFIVSLCALSRPNWNSTRCILSQNTAHPSNTVCMTLIPAKCILKGHKGCLEREVLAGSLFTWTWDWADKVTEKDKKFWLRSLKKLLNLGQILEHQRPLGYGAAVGGYEKTWGHNSPFQRWYTSTFQYVNRRAWGRSSPRKTCDWWD